MGNLKRIEVVVMRAGDALGAFSDTWHRASRGEDGPSRLAFDSLQALFAAITASRPQLVREVARRKPVTPQELSEAVGRTWEDVEADVAELVELGLLERTATGALHAPFDEIVIHAELRDAA
jgi:predicted transcriptional regulator